MRGAPPIEWLEPGQDPTTMEWEPPRRSIRGCLMPFLLLFGFVGIIGITVSWNNARSRPTPTLPTAASMPTDTPTFTVTPITPTATATVTNTPLASATPRPTDTPIPTLIMVASMDIVSVQFPGYTGTPHPTMTGRQYRAWSTQAARSEKPTARAYPKVSNDPQIPTLSFPTTTATATPTLAATDTQQPTFTAQDAR